MPRTLTPIETAQFIKRRDRAFRTVIDDAGPPPSFRPAPVGERFAALTRSITYQLLATSAANTIHARVIERCGGHVSVDSVLAAGPGELRAAGLSTTKALAMLDLAERVRDGSVPVGRHGRMGDDEVVRNVTSVHGIGPWTAHMYLLGTLGRRDVWPVGDYGVRNGWSLLHDLDETISEKELRDLGDRFAGVRSSVAWYCWQAVHFSRERK